MLNGNPKSDWNGWAAEPLEHTRSLLYEPPFEMTPTKGYNVTPPWFKLGLACAMADVIDKKLVVVGLSSPAGLINHR